MNRDQLRNQIAEALNSAYRPNPPGCEDLDETSRHDGHHFSGGCYVCRGDVPKLVDAVSGVVAPLLADRAQDVKWIATERDEATADLVRDATAYRDERDLALWLHAEAVWKVGQQEALTWEAESDFASALNEINRAEEDVDRLRLENRRLRREVEFEANGADNFSGADALAEQVGPQRSVHPTETGGPR